MSTPRSERGPLVEGQRELLSEGLPRTARLLRHNDFVRVERSGTRAEGRYVTLVARAGRGRVGFTVSKKVSLHAVERNRVKRRLREVLRKHKAWWAGRDLVVIARAAAVGRTLVELEADVAAAIAGLKDRPGMERAHGTQAKTRR